MLDLPALLKSERSRLGLTQTAVEYRSGIHQSTYAAYESGRRVPDVASLRLLVGIGFDLSELLKPPQESKP